MTVTILLFNNDSFTSYNDSTITDTNIENDRGKSLHLRSFFKSPCEPFLDEPGYFIYRVNHQKFRTMPEDTNINFQLI